MGALTVGKIQVEVQNIKKTGIFDNVGEYSKGGDSFKASYMCYESGIGSGSVYYEGELFLNSEEADEECANRNKEEVAS